VKKNITIANCSIIFYPNLQIIEDGSMEYSYIYYKTIRTYLAISKY